MLSRGRSTSSILSYQGIVLEQLGPLFLHQFHHILALLKLKLMLMSIISIKMPRPCTELSSQVEGDLEARGAWLLLGRRHFLLIAPDITTYSLLHSHLTGASKMLKILKVIDSMHGKETKLLPFHQFGLTGNRAGGDRSLSLLLRQTPTIPWVSGTGMALRGHRHKSDWRGHLIGQLMLKCGLSDEKSAVNFADVALLSACNMKNELYKFWVTHDD